MSDGQVELLLVDGSALLHRAYHAYPKTFIDKSGKMINAVYGVASILLSAVETINPEYVSVVWDVPKPTFRHEMYIAYKAQRKKTDDELISQIPLVKEMIHAYGLNQAEEEGYEADDLIGSMARKYKDQVDQVVVLTGDQDMMQLVEEKVGVLVPGRGQVGPKMYGEVQVMEKYGIKPEQIVDYKALIGDSSDNIPGVAGVGPKTAVGLLREFGSLEEIYKDLEVVKEKIGERVAKLLETGKDSAYLSRDLAEIKCDVEVKEKLEEMEYEGAQKRELKEFFEKMNFRSLIKRVFGEEKKQDERQIGMF